MLTYREFAKYGVQTTFYFSLEDVSDVEAPFTGAAPVVGDIWITKDGGAAANASNAFVAISNGLFSWTATATEMQATRLLVNVYDATASAIFRPISILILTKLQLGQIDVDATQIGGNTNAIITQGVGTGAGMLSTGGTTGDGMKALGGATSGHGFLMLAQNGTSAGLYGIGAGGGGGISCIGGPTGHGLHCQGGATQGSGLRLDAVAGNSYGADINGFGSGDGINCRGGVTGAGAQFSGGATSGDGFIATTQAGNSSGIKAVARGTGIGLNLSHATDNALITNIFNTLENTEPSAAIGSNASVLQIFQFLKRRFLNLVTQTSTVQTIYKDDSVTPLTTMACSNDGTTQSKGKSS